MLSGHNSNLSAFLNIFGNFHKCFGLIKDDENIKENFKEVC